MTILFTITPQIILIVLPNSPKQPTLLQHQTHFPYRVTLGNQGLVIFRLPAQAQPLRVEPQMNQNQVHPLYTTFVVYLTTTGRQFYCTALS